MLICNALPVSDFQILIKSCSIESRNDPNPKSEVVHETKFSLKNLLFNTCLLRTSMSILYKNVRNVSSGLFTKTSFVYYGKTRYCPEIAVCVLACAGTHPGADTPWSRHSPEQTHPPEQTPSGADTHWRRHPPEQTPPQSRHPSGADTPPRADTPPEQTPPQSRHPLEQTTPRSRHHPGSRHPPQKQTPAYGQ